MTRTIALLSDFGLQDVYVGVMKGAIAQIHPQLLIVDLTHQIPPQNIAAGRFCLMTAYAYFPPETVYVAVVDPGVGSQRRAIAAAFAEGFVVGPDNGLFSGVLSLSPPETAVELTNPNYWRTLQPSTTFHGRDIFAPVGAHLASGTPLEELGTPISLDSLVELSLPNCQLTASGLVGYIQYIDGFGNLVTNIPASVVAGKAWSVSVNDRVITSSSTYSDRPVGEVTTLIGSHGWVEIAVSGGSAKTLLQLDFGNAVRLILQ